MARMGENTEAYKVVAGKPEGKRSRGRPGHGWVAKFDVSPK